MAGWADTTANVLFGTTLLRANLSMSVWIAGQGQEATTNRDPKVKGKPGARGLPPNWGQAAAT